MSSKVKRLLNSFRNRNKVKNDDKYKYDEIINNKIKLLNRDVKQEKSNYKVGKYNVKRKIPNQEELKKVYDNFIKKNNIITNLPKIYQFKLNIKELNLINDNQFMLLNFNLNENKNYLLSVKFDLIQNLKISFVLGNEYFKKEFNIDKNVNGNIMFNTNLLNINFNKYISFMYILFEKNKYIQLKNIDISLNEINKKLVFDITLLKNNNNVIIF